MRGFRSLYPSFSTWNRRINSASYLRWARSPVVCSCAQLSNLPAVGRENVVYPPVTPRWPPGCWADLDEEKAWKMYEKAAAIEDMRCLADKHDELCFEKLYYHPIGAFSDDSPPKLLPYQKYITKTHLVSSELPSMYDSLNVDADLAVLKPIIADALAAEKQRLEKHFADLELNPTVDLSPDEMKKGKAHQMMKIVTDVITSYLAGKHEHLLSAQTDENPTHEAIWWSGGLKEECEGRTDEEDIHFQYKHRPSLTIRVQDPLPEFVPLDNDLCYHPDVAKEWHYIPSIYEMEGRENQGRINPGFLTRTLWNDGNPCEFGQVLINCIPNLNNARDVYGAEEATDLATGCALMSAFGWTLTQAYSQGFSWLNDLTYPLTSQSVVFDGRNISFHAYQLNTITLWKMGENGVPHNNICWSLPEQPLFDEITSTGVHGLSDSALTMLLKFLTLKPEKRDIEMRPYIDDVAPYQVEAFINRLGEEVIERPNPGQFWDRKIPKEKDPLQVTHDKVDRMYERAAQHWNEKTGRFE